MGGQLEEILIKEFDEAYLNWQFEITNFKFLMGKETCDTIYAVQDGGGMRIVPTPPELLHPLVISWKSYIKARDNLIGHYTHLRQSAAIFNSSKGKQCG